MSTKVGFFKSAEMAKKFPLNPSHPERTCWGCDKYCPANALQCGNGSGRTQHPAEMLGEDWYQWGDWGIVAGDTPVDERAAIERLHEKQARQSKTDGADHE